MLSAEQFVEHLLLEDIESRMPHLLAQFPEHTEDSIRDLAVYDPSGGKYITWILKTIRQAGPLTPEAGQRVRQNLERFDKVKRVAEFTGRKDINQYTDFDDLNAAMAEASTVMSKREQEQSLRRIATYKDYSLYQITTEQAAKKFAQNSSLCFVGDVYAKRYVTEQPPLFGVFKGKEPVAALHPFSGQYHNMQNRKLDGPLKRVVLHLVRASREPSLQAYYERELQSAIEQVRLARIRRARERRQRMLQDFNEAGMAPLGEIEGYQLFSVRRTAGLVSALVPEKERADENPVLVMMMPDGRISAMVDAAMGRAVDSAGNQLEPDTAALVGQAFEEFIPEVISPFVREYMGAPNLYNERFEHRMEALHRSFVRDRQNGWTSPKTGVRYDPISEEEAEQRWEIAQPRFEAELRKGWPQLAIRLPSIGMMRVLGYDE